MLVSLLLRAIIRFLYDVEVIFMPFHKSSILQLINIGLECGKLKEEEDPLSYLYAIVLITRDGNDGWRMVSGVWGRPLKSLMVFVKFGSKVYAS